MKEVVKKNIKNELKKWEKKANGKRAIEHLKFVTQTHRQTEKIGGE